MTEKNIIVNSWNEWDPLKHVIVGRADGCCIPPPEPATDPKIPEDSDMKGKHGPRTQESIDKGNAQLDGLSSILYGKVRLGPKSRATSAEKLITLIDFVFKLTL